MLTVSPVTYTPLVSASATVDPLPIVRDTPTTGLSHDRGAGCLFPARVAARLPRVDFDRFRAAIRSSDREVDELLVQLVRAGAAWRISSFPSAEKTESALGVAPLSPEELTVSTTEAARRLNMSRQGVVLAVKAKRLDGKFTGTRWRIRPAAIEEFKARREA